MFFAIGFETTAPSTALTLMRASTLGIRNFSVFCNHVTIIPAIRAILDSPDMRIDGFIGPGHVSTVIGCRPYEWIASDEGKPIVVSGFEPLDILQSVVMLLRQLRDGTRRSRKPVQTRGPLGRKSCGASGDGGSVRVAAVLRMARPGFHFAIGAADSRRVRRVGRRAAFPVPGVRVTDPKAAQCGEVLKGVLEARAMQAVRERMHARASDRRADGFFRGIVRGVSTTTSIARRQLANWPWNEPRSRRRSVPKIRFRDPQIELAHGAGGKASRRLVEGSVRAAADRPARGASGRCGHVSLTARRLAITTDSFVVKPLRFPGGSIGELAVNGTVNDLAVSGARAEALVVTFVLEAGLPTEFSKRKCGRWPRRRSAPESRIVGGDTKVVEHGKADRMYITTAGIGRAAERRIVAEIRAARAIKVLLSGPIGDHGITILLARGELDLEADLRSDTRSVLPLVEALAEAAATGLRWMRDPTRGGVATVAQRTRARLRLGVHLREECDSVARCSARSVRIARARSAAYRERRSIPGRGRAGVCGSCACRSAARSRRRGRRVIGEIRATAGSDGAGHVDVRRNAHGRHAGGRSAARGFAEEGIGMIASSARRPDRTAPAGAQRHLRGIFRSRSRPSGAGVPRNVGTVSARRTAAGVRPRPVCHRRATCLGGVRASGDRRQAGACRRWIFRLLFRPWLEAILRPDDIVMGFGPPEGDPEVIDALR